VEWLRYVSVAPCIQYKIVILINISFWNCNFVEMEDYTLRKRAYPQDNVYTSSSTLMDYVWGNSRTREGQSYNTSKVSMTLLDHKKMIFVFTRFIRTTPYPYSVLYFDVIFALTIVPGSGFLST